MRDPIRVIILGTGQMGCGAARLVLQKPGLKLVGAFARRPHRAGRDLGQLIGLEQTLSLPVAVDLEALIAETQPDIAIQATCSTVTDAMSEITTLIGQGVNVISIAEEMVNARHYAPHIAEQMHWQAVRQGVSVLGTGVNPGFVLDLLVIALTGVCADIQTIRASRINDLAPYGHSVLAAQGIGLTPQAFMEGVENGTIVGHIGFPGSIHLIARAVGWEVEHIEETREPIIARLRRETAHITVEPGQVAGCRHTATAYVGGKPVIELVHPQQICPHLENVDTGDLIEIRGSPDIRFGGSPEIPGGQATAALAVNAIVRVINAVPGLYTMAELPLPAAMLADARSFLSRELFEVRNA